MRGRSLLRFEAVARKIYKAYSETTTTKGTIMNHVKTMAILITANTYQIAVACLPGGFATLPPVSVFNHVLVINDVSAKKTQDGVVVPIMTNCWMSIEDFNWEYVTKGSLTDTKFRKAERIR